MGIHLSELVGSFAALELAGTLLFRKIISFPIAIVLWHTFAIAVAVSVSTSEAFASKTTWLLGKRRNGTIAPRGLIFWQYHAAIRGKLAIQRVLSSENRYDRIGIEESLFLGGWPSDQRGVPGGGSLAVLDVTCELPLRVSADAYLMVPVWDTHSPDVKQIQAAVMWGKRRLEEGMMLFVHCAHGHGRSATVLGAVLIALGEAGTVDEAVKLMQKSRPRVRLNNRQRAALSAWCIEEQRARKD